MAYIYSDSGLFATFHSAGLLEKKIRLQVMFHCCGGDMFQHDQMDYVTIIQELAEIGCALSVEKDHARLLDMILSKAMQFTNADGATLYEVTEDHRTLAFKIMYTESLGISLGGVSGKKIQYAPLSMYLDDGTPNRTMVATAVATSGKSVNIVDAYIEKKYDFSGTKAFDKKMGYRSQSFLTVPMINHLNEVIGVLQLINARDWDTGAIIAFSTDAQKIVESLTSQAAVSITNQRLIEAQKQLFNALIQLVANAIDEKSPYTGGHCRRVPIITRLIADALCNVSEGPYKDFSFTEDEKYEIEVAAWLHDCGKIVTPVHVVDKSKKLETIFDRIHVIDARFEILKRDHIIAALQDALSHAQTTTADQVLANPLLQSQLAQLQADQTFLHTCNIGKETVQEEDMTRLLAIASHRLDTAEGNIALLSENEIHNLAIVRGTLTAEERSIINNHVSITGRMLRALPYPKALSRVPEFASAHHERMDGHGYPEGLTADKLSVQSRIIAISDIFEALSACDRPYKKPLPLSNVLIILGEMSLSGHIDPALFDVFMQQEVYMTYAKSYLKPEQIDHIDFNAIPGYKHNRL